MRKAIKKPMTDKAISIMLARLGRLSTDPEEQVKILEQSIANCWSNIYELKDDTRDKKPKAGQSMEDIWGLGGIK